MSAPASVPTTTKARKPRKPRRKAAPKPSAPLATVHQLFPRRILCNLVIEDGVIYGAETYRPGATILVTDMDKVRAPLAPVYDLAAYRAKRRAGGAS